jgi:hypothetical protein
MNTNEYFIEKDFSDLAGPYEHCEMSMMNNVINDMISGNIEHKVEHREDGYYVMRKNMILRKPQSK